MVLPDVNGKPFSTFIQPDPGHDIDSPVSLMSRGWCLQERILSPRILHFQNWEILFECFTFQKCECETLHLSVQRPNNRMVKNGKLSEILRMDPQMPKTMDQDTVEAHWSSWNGIARLYSPTALSQSTDRLAALSSLAQ